MILFLGIAYIAQSDYSDLDKINKSDNMRFCELLPSFETISETSKFTNFSPNDVDLNLPFLSNSKYYSVYDFQKLKIQKNLNIFHSNVNGLESKFEGLHDFLSGACATLDVIAITETSQQKDEFFTSSYFGRLQTVLYTHEYYQGWNSTLCQW